MGRRASAEFYVSQSHYTYLVGKQTAVFTFTEILAFARHCEGLEESFFESMEGFCKRFEGTDHKYSEHIMLAYRKHYKRLRESQGKDENDEEGRTTKTKKQNSRRTKGRGKLENVEDIDGNDEEYRTTKTEKQF